METRAGNPKARVHADLVRDSEDAVMVYIGSVPIEVRRARMPKTFERLVEIMEKANQKK